MHDQGKEEGVNSQGPSTQRELTYGEKAVGLKFNPGGNPQVDEVKKLYAKIIDAIIHSGTPDKETDREREERLSMANEAIRQAQTAQMWAVKVITWK